MKLSQKINYDRLSLPLAFLLPVLGFFGVMICRGFIPFGDTSMLYSDMYHQYYPFFVSFRRSLLAGESLLLNWDVGLGINYLGLIAYYLASPLNLLSIFLPEGWLLGYFSLLAPIKLGFAGLFFAIFLKKLFRKKDISIAVFGCFYALCAWALGYHWNVMWLDPFALLPLAALGTVSLLREKKFVLYTVSLFFSIVCNYYIGFFTCIFIALVFICYQICRFTTLKRLMQDLGRIAVFSALAIGMTAFLELPAFMALQTTQSSVNAFPQGFTLNIADENTWLGLLDAMRQVAGNMNGGIAPNYKDWDALPNLYCGIFSTVLAFLFLTCKQVKARDRICSVVLLLFLNISVIIRQLDYIWHGFHFTNMIPYRFSFLYSFVVLYMAYRAYTMRRCFKLWQIMVAFVLTIGILVCGKDQSDLTFWAYNCVYILLYFLVLLLPHLYRAPKKDASFEEIQAACQARRERRQISGILLLCIMGMEMVLNLVNFGMDFTGTVVSDYPRGTRYSEIMIAYMKERTDEPFYRAEVTKTQTLNDGALNGYNGITTFTSSANVSVTRYMQALGFGAKDTYNRYSFQEGSPAANLFLALRYMIDRDGQVTENAYFDHVHSYDSVHLLENNAYLPLGFLADPQILSVDFATAYTALDSNNGNWNKLQFQNKLFRAATDTNEDIWSFVNGNHLSIFATDVTLSDASQTGSCDYTAGSDKGGTIIYKYVVNKNGYLCLDLYTGLYNASHGATNHFSVWKNGTELFNGNYSLSQVYGVADVVPGDVVELHMECKANEEGYINVHAGILDEEIFRDGYELLAASTLQLENFTGTYIDGTITCDRNGVLYTSIPQDGNWIAMVDGEPAEIVKIGDVMVGLLLSEGTHRVHFMYRSYDFTIGCCVSILSVFIFLIILIVSIRKHYKKRKIV